MGSLRIPSDPRIFLEILHKCSGDAFRNSSWCSSSNFSLDSFRNLSCGSFRDFSRHFCKESSKNFLASKLKILAEVSPAIPAMIYSWYSYKIWFSTRNSLAVSAEFLAEISSRLVLGYLQTFSVGIVGNPLGGLSRVIIGCWNNLPAENAWDSKNSRANYFRDSSSITRRIPKEILEKTSLTESLQEFLEEL